MQPVEFIAPVNHRGCEYKIGDKDKLPEREAERLLAGGFVTLGNSKQSKPPAVRRLSERK